MRSVRNEDKEGPVGSTSGLQDVAHPARYTKPPPTSRPHSCFPAVLASGFTAADIFHSGPLDAHWTGPASGCVASLSHTHTHKTNKTTQPDPLGGHQRRGDVLPPDQTRRGPTPADAIWAHGDDGQGKVTGRQSGARRTHGSVYRPADARPR